MNIVPSESEKYNSKRDFEITSEPAGVSHETKRKKGGLAFVVQKHAASHLHYDFRLEINGVLVSWALPKGPSLDPDVKRLAVHVEDHPLECAVFEGTIPKGQYGGGEMIVWDHGKWIPVEPSDPEDFEKFGVLKFELQGEKLKGMWHLFKMETDDKGDYWLLRKQDDKFAKPGSTDQVLRQFPNSVLSDKPLKKSRGWRKRRPTFTQ